MSENNTSEKLEPVFDFTSQESVILDSGNMELHSNGNIFPCNGEVRLDLTPSPSIHFYASFDSSCSVPFFPPPVTGSSLSLYFKGKKVDGFPLSFGGFKSTDGERVDMMPIKWCPASEPITGIGNEDTRINHVVFHLCNFPEFSGFRDSSEKVGSALHAIHYIDLEYDKWIIELKSLTTTNQNIKQLKVEGGNRLTHVGQIRKADSSDFTGKETNEILDATRHFISFANGCWCNPVCAVGFDKNKVRVWESWISPQGRWRNSISWFDPRHGEQLVQLFPLFMKKWGDEFWREALREIIYLYLSANDSSHGIDIGIIVTQAALERFSYEYSVNDRKLLSSEGFKSLRASDKYRMFFSSLQLPLDIPAETSDLVAQSKQNNFRWTDAPESLTEIRNSLVHPDHKKRGKMDNVLFDTWNLGLWYLELGTLALCEYKGSYSNRLRANRWVGQVEQVPW